MKDRFGAGGEQLLHVQFGRRLQEAAAFDAERFDVKLGNDFVREQRRFDFDEVAVVEELSQLAEQVAALGESGERCGRAWNERGSTRRISDAPLID